MSLDDLLGLLFVLFFIVLPALQGLFRPVSYTHLTLPTILLV